MMICYPISSATSTASNYKYLDSLVAAGFHLKYLHIIQLFDPDASDRPVEDYEVLQYSWHKWLMIPWW